MPKQLPTKHVHILLISASHRCMLQLSAHTAPVASASCLLVHLTGKRPLSFAYTPLQPWLASRKPAER
jgi:hypothetical protein